MSILIIGASGLIGKYLSHSFKSKGISVIGTCYKQRVPGLIEFDLAKPNLRTLGITLRNITHAVICGGITDMDRCKRDLQYSYAVNVVGVKEVIQQLREEKIIPIFFSSDYVFDGTRGNYAEDDLRKPLLTYGIQKKEVEDFLLEKTMACIIARIAKVYSYAIEDETLLTSLMLSLINGVELKLAVDQVFSPTYVGDVCEVLHLLIGKKLFGCYHVTSGEPINRYDLACMLKSDLRIHSGRIIPCHLKDVSFDDVRPHNTSMNNQKVIKATGFRFTALGESITHLKTLAEAGYTR